MSETIGFIGLGVMGRPMAKHLVAKGHALVVHNRSRHAVDELVAAGARVRGYDPVARHTAAPLMPAVEICDDPYQMADGSDALVVVTPWNEFKQLDLEKVRDLLKSPVIYDGRNIYDPVLMKELGFTYRAIGRGLNGK